MPKLQPLDYCRAARCPPTLEEQEFGLWAIKRRTWAGNTDTKIEAIQRVLIGADSQTLLYHATESTMHTDGEIVMEDSLPELRRHLPIWLAARGRILVTGLGLGCVVRGLLASPDVSHIDVIEIDADIVRIVGAEFAGESRVSIIQGDALTCPFPAEQWDFAWHDIWCEGNTKLAILHTELMARFVNKCDAQGAWMFPRDTKRYWRRHPDLSWRLLG